MNFSIKFLDKQTNSNFQIGEITMNDYSEKFQSSLSYWNKANYVDQWKDGVQRLFNGNNRSCLVTSMLDPNISSYICLWLLYTEKNIVHIQNQILFLEELNEPFDESRIYYYISDREIIDEDGHKISEWDIQIDDLKVFLDSY